MSTYSAAWKVYLRLFSSFSAGPASALFAFFLSAPNEQPHQPSLGLLPSAESASLLSAHAFRADARPHGAQYRQTSSGTNEHQCNAI